MPRAANGEGHVINSKLMHYMTWFRISQEKISTCMIPGKKSPVSGAISQDHRHPAIRAQSHQEAYAILLQVIGWDACAQSQSLELEQVPVLK